MIQIAPVSREAAPQLVEIWNAAFGPDFPLSERLLAQSLWHDPFFEPQGLFAARDGERIVGWALSKTMKSAGAQMGRFQNRGGLGALCVHPDHQLQGIGSRLLEAVETHLHDAASPLTTLYYPHHLLPGVPVENASAVAFFQKYGYTGHGSTGGECYDLWRDLDTYQIPEKVHAALTRNPGVEIRPARGGEANAICEFVEREFPGGWTYSMRRHFAHGGKPEDVIIALEAGEILGFCHTADFHSLWLLPSVYWHPLLGEHYGGLGPIGLALEHRKRGLGLALCALAVEDLKQRGVTRMGIDWTELLDFYGQLGFTVWKRYWQAEKFSNQ